MRQLLIFALFFLPFFAKAEEFSILLSGKSSAYKHSVNGNTHVVETIVIELKVVNRDSQAYSVENQIQEGGLSAEVFLCNRTTFLCSNTPDSNSRCTVAGGPSKVSCSLSFSDEKQAFQILLKKDNVGVSRSKFLSIADQTTPSPTNNDTFEADPFLCYVPSADGGVALGVRLKSDFDLSKDTSLKFYSVDMQNLNACWPQRARECKKILKNTLVCENAFSTKVSINATKPSTTFNVTCGQNQTEPLQVMWDATWVVRHAVPYQENGATQPAHIPVCPEGFTTDEDGDKISDADDNCRSASNADQLDQDADQKGDVCDNCPGVANEGQEDENHDGTGNACEQVESAGDEDGDTIPDATDNCAFQANPAQTDSDQDGFGDVCDECPQTAALLPADKIPQCEAQRKGCPCTPAPQRFQQGVDAATGAAPREGCSLMPHSPWNPFEFLWTLLLVGAWALRKSLKPHSVIPAPDVIPAKAGISQGQAPAGIQGRRY